MSTKAKTEKLRWVAKQEPKWEFCLRGARMYLLLTSLIMVQFWCTLYHLKALDLLFQMMRTKPEHLGSFPSTRALCMGSFPSTRATKWNYSLLIFYYFKVTAKFDWIKICKLIFSAIQFPFFSKFACPIFQGFHTISHDVLIKFSKFHYLSMYSKCFQFSRVSRLSGYVSKV